MIRRYAGGKEAKAENSRGREMWGEAWTVLRCTEGERGGSLNDFHGAVEIGGSGLSKKKKKLLDKAAGHQKKERTCEFS